MQALKLLCHWRRSGGQVQLVLRLRFVVQQDCCQILLSSTQQRYIALLRSKVDAKTPKSATLKLKVFRKSQKALLSGRRLPNRKDVFPNQITQFRSTLSVRHELHIFKFFASGGRPIEGCRLYLHRIIFIVIDTLTSCNAAHFFDCDDVCRLANCTIMLACPSLMRAKFAIALNSQ